jgi:osmoprotectant transport system permease protein
MDTGWILDHLDDLAYRLVQHIYLAGIAIVLGFFISLVLAILAVRRRSTYGPIVAISDILFTIPSVAVFVALVPITGLTTVTVEVPLVMYTLLIFVRNITAGLDSVPADVLEAADGMGYTRRRRLWQVEFPLALPLVIAGLRLASVSTIGLVTVSGILGDNFGGLGFFIFAGYHISFPTELYFGAIPSILLAIAADIVFVQIQKRATPWAAAAAGRLA